MSAAAQPIAAKETCKPDNARDQVLCKIAVCSPADSSPYKPRSISPRELPIPTCTVEFYLGVTRCPDGNARGCSDLNNRGLELGYDVTVWPRNRHPRLTTGEGEEFHFVPELRELNQTEKRMCSILGLHPVELLVFLKSWQPKVLNLHDLHQRLRLDDRTGEIVDAKLKGWDCKDCGHMWLAKNKRQRCPHCDSAWWWKQ